MSFQAGVCAAARVTTRNELLNALACTLSPTEALVHAVLRDADGVGPSARAAVQDVDASGAPLGLAYVCDSPDDFLLALTVVSPSLVPDVGIAARVGHTPLPKQVPAPAAGGRAGKVVLTVACPADRLLHVELGSIAFDVPIELSETPSAEPDKQLPRGLANLAAYASTFVASVVPPA
jgi:hypothetical protein